MYEQQNYFVPPQLSAFFIERSEKRRIRNTAWAVAVPCYVFFIITSLLGVILSLVGYRLGLGTEFLTDITSDPAVNQVLEITLSIFLMTVPFIIAAKVAGYNISESGGFNKPKKGTALPHLLFGVGFCAFANIAVSKAGEFFEQFGIDYSIPPNEYPQGVFGFLLVLISTAIVPGLLEEFAFRGIVLGLLRPFGDAFAIIASSAVFGILHGNFEQMPFAFLVGLALGFIRVKSGSIAVCMAVHAANNLVAVITSYAGGMSAAALNLVYTVYVLLALIAAVLGIVLLKYKGEFSFPEVRRPIAAKKVYLGFFFSPAMILFYCLFFTRAFIYVYYYF